MLRFSMRRADVLILMNVGSCKCIQFGLPGVSFVRARIYYNHNPSRKFRFFVQCLISTGSRDCSLRRFAIISMVRSAKCRIAYNGYVTQTRDDISLHNSTVGLKPIALAYS